MAGTSPVEFWEMLEWISAFFYDPAIFWGIPLILALLWAIFRRYR